LGIRTASPSPHSKDLPSSDLFLFPKLKSKLCGRHFGNNNDVIHAVEAQLQAQDTPFCKEGIGMLELW
jgi:hypothetical protein